MKKVIVPILLVDLFGKLAYLFPWFLMGALMLIFFYLVYKIDLLKRLEEIIIKSLRHINLGRYYYNFVVVPFISSLVVLFIMVCSQIGLQKLFANGWISDEQYAFSFVMLIFFSYLALCLVIFNMFFRAKDVILKIKNSMVTIAIAILIMLMTEAISAPLFYKDGFYQYKQQYYLSEITSINSNTNAEAIYKILSEIAYSDAIKELPGTTLEELIHTLRDQIGKSGLSLEDQLANRLDEYQVSSTVEEDDLPSLFLFWKLFRFAFYQHYVLGLNDEMNNYQKYIASDAYRSAIQMVHILFARLIDLFIIGKIVTLPASAKYANDIHSRKHLKKCSQNSITYVDHSIPTVREYFDLVESTGWPGIIEKGSQKMAAALSDSWYIVCAYDGERLVGSGRVVSDGAHQALICDLIVLQEYQGKEIGSEILARLLKKCAEHDITMVSLFASQGKGDYYKRFGFEERPHDAPGMRWVKRDIF